jgi:hypothetical protein
MQNLCLGPNALFRGTEVVKHPFYSIGPKKDVWECFGVFRKPSACNKMQNLCFGPECTISGNQSCVASIILHWTQNDVYEYFGAFC